MRAQAQQQRPRITADDQRDKLRLICRFIAESGHPPTRRELCKVFRMTSMSSIDYRLDQMIAAGYLTIDREVTRGIKPTPLGWRLAGFTANGEEERIDPRSVPGPWPLESCVRGITRFGDSLLFEVGS